MRCGYGDHKPHYRPDQSILSSFPWFLWMHIYVFVMGKKVAVAQNSAGSHQHDNQRIYDPCSFYGWGFWTTASTHADDNTDTAMVSDIRINLNCGGKYEQHLVRSCAGDYDTIPQQKAEI